MPKKKSKLKKKATAKRAKTKGPLKKKSSATKTTKKPTNTLNKTTSAKTTVSRTTPKKKQRTMARKQTQTKSESQQPAPVPTVKALNTPKSRKKTSKNNFREDKIRTLAHHKWEEAGCPICDGVEFWLAAEQHVDAESGV